MMSAKHLVAVSLAIFYTSAFGFVAVARLVFASRYVAVVAAFQ